MTSRSRRDFVSRRGPLRPGRRRFPGGASPGSDAGVPEGASGLPAGMLSWPRPGVSGNDDRPAEEGAFAGGTAAGSCKSAGRKLGAGGYRVGALGPVPIVNDRMVLGTRWGTLRREDEGRPHRRAGTAGRAVWPGRGALAGPGSGIWHRSCSNSRKWVRYGFGMHLVKKWSALGRRPCSRNFAGRIFHMLPTLNPQPCRRLTPEAHCVSI